MTGKKENRSSQFPEVPLGHQTKQLPSRCFVPPGEQCRFPRWDPRLVAAVSKFETAPFVLGICNGAIWDSTKEEQKHKKKNIYGNARYILRTRIYLNIYKLYILYYYIYIDNVPSPLASTLNTINTLKTWQHKRSQTDASRSRCSTAICNLWWRTSQQVAILAIGNLHKRVCDLSGELVEPQKMCETSSSESKGVQKRSTNCMFFDKKKASLKVFYAHGFLSKFKRPKKHIRKDTLQEPHILPAKRSCLGDIWYVNSLHWTTKPMKNEGFKPLKVLGYNLTL